MSQISRQVQYVISVEGPVDGSLVDWLGPVTIASVVQRDGRVITKLSGIGADQSGLVGLIRYLHGLGLVLLAFERVVPSGEER